MPHFDKESRSYARIGLWGDEDDPRVPQEIPREPWPHRSLDQSAMWEQDRDAALEWPADRCRQWRILRLRRSALVCDAQAPMGRASLVRAAALVGGGAGCRRRRGGDAGAVAVLPSRAACLLAAGRVRGPGWMRSAA